jgi:hypothetical protein
LPLVVSATGGGVVEGGAGGDVVGAVGGRVVLGDETGADGELEHAASESASAPSVQTAATRYRRRARVAVGLASFVPCTSKAFSGGVSIV